MDAEFSGKKGTIVKPESVQSATLGKIRDILKHRDEFMNTLLTRARAVERDIDQWASQAVVKAMNDTQAEIDFSPPTSLFDVEPPF